MKRVIWLAILSTLIAAPSWLMAQEGHGDYDHATVGIFADYFRFSPTSSHTTNFVGFGARAAFNASKQLQLEGEMNYDFERNFTTTFNNGATTSFVTTRVRPLTGLFGPKFQTPGPFKFFVTGKVGFINFTKTNAAVTPGTVGNAISGDFYPIACSCPPGFIAAQSAFSVYRNSLPEPVGNSRRNPHPAFQSGRTHCQVT